MKNAILVAAAALAAISSAAWAEDQGDKSGTNPAVLNRSAGISNEYRFLGEDNYYNILSMKYTEPFADGRMSLRANVPVNSTNLGPGSEAGLGDASAKLTWVAHVDSSMALVLSNDVSAPTASEDVLGSGKWVTSPGITWAKFIGPEFILAPAYVHAFSFAGDSDRADINSGTFDLYAVYKPKGERWWLTGDFTWTHDYETGRDPMSLEFAYGRNLAVLENGAALNGSIRPGIGIGEDRPYDFNIEVGLTLVGF